MKKKRASGSTPVRQSLARRVMGRLRDLWKRDPLAVVAASLFLGAFLVFAYPTNFFETFPVWFKWDEYRVESEYGIFPSYWVEVLGVGFLLPIVEIEWCSATNTFVSDWCQTNIPFPRIRQLGFYEWFSFFDKDSVVESQYWTNRLIGAAALLISSGFVLLLRLRPVTSRR